MNGVRIAFLGGVMSDLVTRLLPPEYAGPWKVPPIVDTVRELSEKLSDGPEIVRRAGGLRRDRGPPARGTKGSRWSTTGSSPAAGAMASGCAVSISSSSVPGRIRLLELEEDPCPKRRKQLEPGDIEFQPVDRLARDLVIDWIREKKTF